ncbi:MAG: hypothetical protein KU37_05015 [Sulfuricurvum sp. PC08-66]|nr:MAG: hypothetical protein KU37_05015 [Sulfuricurvum sp. PC08-66]
MNIEKIKLSLGNNRLLHKVLDDAVRRGFLTPEGDTTPKFDEFNSRSIDAYCEYMLAPQHVMFKVEGITLENVSLEVFDYIRDSINGIINIGWHTEKENHLKVNKEDYENNVTVSLRSASFQVDVLLPSIAKESTREKIDTLINGLINNSDIRIDKITKALLEPMQKILTSSNVTGIKISTDQEVRLEEAPMVVRAQASSIQSLLHEYEESLVQNQEDEIFDEDVIVFASDSKKRTFDGFARDLKTFTFDCKNLQGEGEWSSVLTHQIEAVNELNTAVKIHVQGRFKNGKRILVDSITLA